MQCPSVHTLPPVHPSILPSISPARGPFALCQAILIPIYHLFLAAPSFLSARSSSARPSFLNPSTPIGFFRGLSFERLSSSLYPSSSLFLSFSLSSFLRRRMQAVRVRICSPVSFRPVQRTFLFLATSGNEARGSARRKVHDDVRSESCRKRRTGPNTRVRFIPHENGTLVIR